MDSTNVQQIRAELLKELRKLNKSARHYFVTPPTASNKQWIAGWVDDLSKPRMSFIEGDLDPQNLISKIRIETASK